MRKPLIGIATVWLALCAPALAQDVQNQTTPSSQTSPPAQSTPPRTDTRRPNEDTKTDRPTERSDTAKTDRNTERRSAATTRRGIAASRRADRDRRAHRNAFEDHRSTRHDPDRHARHVWGEWPRTPHPRNGGAMWRQQHQESRNGRDTDGRGWHADRTLRFENDRPDRRGNWGRRGREDWGWQTGGLVINDEPDCWRRDREGLRWYAGGPFWFQKGRHPNDWCW